MTCLDAYGDTLYYFTQWDTNQKLYIAGSTLTEAPMVHWQNKNTKKALVVRSSIGADGTISADVPNSLLAEPYPITAYIYAAKGDSAKAVWQTTIPVRKRAMPEGFLYDGNTGVGDMSEALKRLEEQMKEMQSKIEEMSGMLEGNVVVDKDDSEGKEHIYIPEGDIVYLYEHGNTSNLIGEWDFSILEDNVTSDELSISYGTEYISIQKSAINKGYVCELLSNHKIDFSQYAKLCFDYECDDRATSGEKKPSFGVDVIYDRNISTVGFLTVMQPTEADGGRHCKKLDLKQYMGEAIGENTLDEKGNLLMIFNLLVLQETSIKIHAIWIEKEDPENTQ